MRTVLRLQVHLRGPVRVVEDHDVGRGQVDACQQRYRWHLKENATQMPAILWQLTATAEDLADSEWNHCYTREEAVYPLPGLRVNKYWPPVNRIDNVFGDRNVVCSCPPIESYQEVEA